MVTYLGCDTVLLDKGLLGEVELERIVGTQTDIETAVEEGREGVALIVQEQGVVGQGRHGNTHLGQVEQVLQSGDLAQENTVRDTKGSQEGRGQVIRVTGFTTVGSKHERVWKLEEKESSLVIE